MEEAGAGFGHLLRQYRERAGLTQEALAERAGLTTSAIASLERGRRRRPFPHTVRQLTEALALSADERAAFGHGLTPRGIGGNGSPPPSPVDAPRSNLPPPPNRLIGRERETTALIGLVPEHEGRLVTLTGVGGCGKTRLALQVAADLRPAFPDGVWLVELAALAEPALVPRTVLASLANREGPGGEGVDTLAAFLATQTLLLVLDNCEHLVDACAALAGQLLASCPNLRILATSREPLQVAGERAWRVPPLAAPDLSAPVAADDLPRYPAVQLFLERARAAAPGFRLTSANAGAVGEACARLEGIPLALELAAARARVLAVEQIAARLDDTLRLLTGGSRAAPTRQQTLRAALDWSHALLSPAEQAVFRRLAAFAGGCDLEAVEAVCGDEREGGAAAGTVTAEDVLDLLSQLADKSLVQVTQGDGVARYHLLEPVRQYAARLLAAQAEAGAVRARHAGYYVDLAERAAPELRGPAQVAWLQRLEREHDNLRAALRWTVEWGDEESGLRLATALVFFWEGHSHLSEGRQWLDRLLATARPEPADAALWARALLGAGQIAEWQNDLEAAEERFQACLAFARAEQDQSCAAWALAWVGLVRSSTGQYARAVQLLEESLDLFRALGERPGVAFALLTLGVASGYQGDAVRAESLLAESLACFLAVGDIRYIAITRTTLGLIALILRDPARALTLTAEGLSGHWEVGDRTYLVNALMVNAGARRELGQPVQAVRLLGAAEALREALGTPLGAATAAMHDGLVARLRAQLGEEAVGSAWAAGHALTLNQAVTEARAAIPSVPSPARVTPLAAGAAHEPLTPREQEVAHLLTQGWSDRQIASTLAISRRTVGVHVQHVLAKLGAHSRWQVADRVAARTPGHSADG